MPIVVLGSKPGAKLPAVAAPYVLTANNAVELGAHYREQYGSKVIAFVPGEELLRHEHIRRSFEKAQPDEVVILGGGKERLESLIREEMRITAPIRFLSFKECRGLARKALGARYFIVALRRLFARGASHFINDFIPDLFNRRDMRWLTDSTGFVAIFYALDRWQSADIIAAGIGLSAGGHFSGEGTYSEKTARADRLVISRWDRSRRNRLYTTDEALHNIANVPLWKGPPLEN